MKKSLLAYNENLILWWQGLRPSTPARAYSVRQIHFWYQKTGEEKEVLERKEDEGEERMECDPRKNPSALLGLTVAAAIEEKRERRKRGRGVTEV
jgi:hypothetical protein